MYLLRMGQNRTLREKMIVNRVSLGDLLWYQPHAKGCHLVPNVWKYFRVLSVKLFHLFLASKVMGYFFKYLYVRTKIFWCLMGRIYDLAIFRNILYQNYYGPTQVKCRLLITIIFDAMNFQHFSEMLEFNS